MTSYLGQLAQNRLLNLRTDNILARRMLYVDFLNPALFKGESPLTMMNRRVEILGQPDYQTLELVRTNPSQDEISDLGLIDAFWGPNVSPVSTLFDTPYDTGVPNYTNIVGNVTPAQARGYYMCRIPVWLPEASGVEVTPPSGDIFCCPTEPDLPDPYSPDKPNHYFMSSEVGGGAWSAGWRFNAFPPRAAFWDRAMGSSWAEMKALIPNYVEIERVLEWYPFPEPFQRDYAFILGTYILPELREFAATPGVLNETIIRMFLTLTVLEKYGAMSAAVQEYLEEQADNEKRNMIIRTAAIAVIGAVIGAGLAAAAIGTTTTAMVTKGIAALGNEFSKERQAEFAKDIEAASEAMKADDPEFAAEVKYTSDILKFLSGDTGQLGQLSPEEQAKIAAGEGGPGILAVAGIGGAALLALYLVGAFD